MPASTGDGKIAARQLLRSVGFDGGCGTSTVLWPAKRP